MQVGKLDEANSFSWFSVSFNLVVHKVQEVVVAQVLRLVLKHAVGVSFRRVMCIPVAVAVV